MIKEFTKEGKSFGWYREDDGIFRKKVNSSKHKMKILDSYGIEKWVVDELDELPVKEIKIKEVDSGQIWFITYEKFKEFRFEKNFQSPQVFIQLKHLTMIH